MSKKPIDFTETMLTSDLVYQGRLLRVLEDTVRLPDGKTTGREYVQHPGAVMMIPFLDDATVVLIRQFRYPVGRHFIELPAGKIDPGEEPLATARRELVEECGFEAESWRRLATIHPCIGYSDERIEIYLAHGLKDVGHTPDDEGFVQAMPTPLGQALEWVEEGRITDAKTIVGLMWAEKIAKGA